MKKNYLGLLVIFLTVCFLCNSVNIAAYAGNDGMSALRAEVSPEGAVCEPGETVSIPIYFNNVPLEGINSCIFNVDYDKTKLTLKTLTPGSIVYDHVNDIAYNASENMSTGLKILYSNYNCTEECKIRSDGIFCTLEFEVDGSVQPGTQVPVYARESEGISFYSDGLLPIMVEFGSSVIMVSYGTFPAASLLPFTEGTFEQIPQETQTPVPDSESVPDYNHSMVYGDLSGDFRFDSADYNLMQAYLLGRIDSFPNPNWRIVGDVNDDGRIDSADYSLMRAKILHIIEYFPAEINNPSPTPTPVTDDTPPRLTIPGDKVAEATGLLTQIDIGTASADDESRVSITNDAPESYPLGTTIVTWTAVDASGNTATAVQRITIIDTTQPVLNIPADITVEASGEKTEIDIGAAEAQDIFPVTVSNDAPGAFCIGTTLVTWSATDINGNRTVRIQRITVTDTNLPLIDISGVSDNAEYMDSVFPDISIIDNESGIKASEITLDDMPYEPGTPISSIGRHTLRVSASDYADNTSQIALNFRIFKHAEISVTAVSAEYSDAAMITARLLSDGMHLAGKSLRITVDNMPPDTAITDTDGKVSVTKYVNLGEGVYPIEVEMVGGPEEYYLCSNVTESLTVLKEKADLEYTGMRDAYYSQPITLSAHIGQDNDCIPGDLTLIDVTFEVAKVNNDGTVVFINSYTAKCDADGNASTVQNFAKGVYSVVIKLKDNNYFETSSETVSITVGSLDRGYAFGAGCFKVTDPETGTLGKAEVGFLVNNGNGGTTGYLVFYSKENNITMTGTGISYLFINSGYAQFQGTATIKGRPGVFTYKIICVDDKRILKPDRFTIKIWSGTSTNDETLIYEAVDAALNGIILYG